MFRNSLKGNNLEYKNNLLVKMHEACDILEEYKSKGYKINSTWILDYFTPRLNETVRMFPMCSGQIASIGPDGSISGCTKGPLNCKEVIAGTIWDDSPLELIKIKSKDWKQQFDRPGYSEECLTCKARFSCNGGCVWDRLYTNNTLVGPYPFCQLHKEIFPRLEEIHCD